ncbi:Acetyltransferase (GNAT) family protein [Pseudarcicella hirudinis]|uniref:Acetyltransferase (GNAT) family protein n=1 Tax=Pseudarcicella hirudinis TaxID=1079859 RepID=A0A1I5YMK3_9BACT|nr:GNAT family N-acetyltransferase [Pseudarcicella hirudinis]SFQ45436.1 Acetyltransferase (GNAT) family protein [Pseudarcicella hirudinis]
MKYLIRKCEERDLENLISLCAKHAAYEQAAHSQTGKAEALKHLLFKENPPLFCWIIDIDRQAAGYFSYTFDYSTWDAQNFLYLDCLYIEANFRGLGIGEEVFKKLRRIAEQENCINIQWQTPSSNEAAIRFYHRMGAQSFQKQRFCLRIAAKDERP